VVNFPGDAWSILTVSVFLNAVMLDKLKETGMINLVTEEIRLRVTLCPGFEPG